MIEIHRFNWYVNLLWLGLSMESIVAEPCLVVSAVGDGGGGSNTPNAFSWGAIRKDKDLNATGGLPANVEGDM